MASQTLADKLDAIAERLSIAAQRLRSGAMSLEKDTHERMGLVMAGVGLVNMVSQPRDKMILPLIQFAHFTAIRMFIKWKAFEKIPLADGAAVSYGELAEQLGADLSLITRFAGCLVANGTLRQIGPDKLAHTELSKFYVSENPIWAMAQLGFDSQLTSFVAMPKYFDHFGMVEPTNRLQTVVAFAEGQLGSTVWEIIQRDELRLKTTTLAMGAAEEHMPALGSYDLSWVVQVAANSGDRPLVVDVGGGKGQALKSIFTATPGLPRHRCVLEDLAEVVEASKDDPELTDVKKVAIDFHKDQPVKGALVYYMRRCLHDYSDEECVGVLQHISSAMAADSKLLIVETLMTNPPSPLQAAMDFMMLTLSGKERTLEGFKAITGRAGLKITKVSEIPGFNAVVECGLA
ncbi:(RS)-norcoclaurine 6-O-methyltransferase [Madurella mycetomatis]|uniref:(RS)-norcoclaurine 6-O-methyltransferase n=1 Tax=Madurella mycetomatis TaxID=100816 RepID=A0A175W9Z5_9PEZI|nr:(RS)-norcoclaurine 6-O-methyltransferase [Madurella mycetomatis]